MRLHFFNSVVIANSKMGYYGKNLHVGADNYLKEYFYSLLVP